MTEVMGNIKTANVDKQKKIKIKQDRNTSEFSATLEYFQKICWRINSTSVRYHKFLAEVPDYFIT